MVWSLFFKIIYFWEKDVKDNDDNANLYELVVSFSEKQNYDPQQFQLRSPTVPIKSPIQHIAGSWLPSIQPNSNTTPSKSDHWREEFHWERDSIFLPLGFSTELLAWLSLFLKGQV